MKFSIITPAYGVATWLPETIESVLSQAGDFEIEYILVINISPDDTLAIAKAYKEKLESGRIAVACNKITMQILEPGEPHGMYVAINQGFEVATGDIQAWIAGDDIYQPSAFAIVARAFAEYPDILWLKGKTATIGEKSERLYEGYTRIYHRDWLRLGVYGMEAYHVEQDSTFWRPELWKKAGPFPAFFKSSGDYWLWIQFAQVAPLWSINAPFSCFRKRAGQDSRVNAARLLEQKIRARGPRPLAALIPRLFFWPYFHVPAPIRPLFEFLYPIVFPFRSRKYLSIEGDRISIREMPTFHFK
jgi:glycosyltransferase involved in cell wall biosynthesis